MKPSIIPSDLKGKELFEFVSKNEALIIHAKKSEMKKADGLVVTKFLVNEKGQFTTKAASDRPVIPDTATTLSVDVVINTTNYFDSHYDVHIPGIWNKSLKDNKKTGFYLLDTHGRHFQDVIGEGLQGTANNISWKELGFNYPGFTEALMFSGSIYKVRNPYMFDQYAKGYVKQHSVGMTYVKLVTCINDDDYPVQKENWDKYIKMVVNADEAEAEGIFWAVLEAKVNEGSAVLFASNDLTPCYNIEDISTEGEPDKSTQSQPLFDISKAIKETKFFKS